VSTLRPPPDEGDPPARRPRDAVETRRRLLDAAEAEFAAKGFAGARLRDVAHTAGVQQALIHHYFVDKEGLYRAVLEHAIAETTEGSWSILGSVNGIVPLLEGFIDMLVRFYASHANLLAILRMEASSGSSVALEVMRERTKPVFDAVHALLQRMQENGDLRRDVPATEMILAVLSMTLFPFQEERLLQALWPGPITADTIEIRKKAIVQMALDGILPQRA
jgi:TetR/AcrR family transcriptional regulator